MPPLIVPQIIKTRIDKVGVTSRTYRNWATDGSSSSFRVSKNPSVRKLPRERQSSSSGETYDNTEIYPMLEEANKALKLTGAADTTVQAETINTDSLTVPADTLKDATAAADTAAKSEDLVAQLGDKERRRRYRENGYHRTKSFEDFARENPFFAVLTPSVGQNEQGTIGTAQRAGHRHVVDQGHRPCEPVPRHAAGAFEIPA